MALPPNLPSIVQHSHGCLLNNTSLLSNAPTKPTGNAIMALGRGSFFFF